MPGPPSTPFKSILKRSSSESDIVNISHSKVLQLDKGAGPEKLAPPSVPYLGYSMPYNVHVSIHAATGTNSTADIFEKEKD